MDRASMYFCLGALGVSLLVSAAAAPFAMVPQETVEKAHKALPAEEMGEVDLGDFGMVAVSDLVSHYIENPPAAPAGGARKVRFEGC